MRCRWFQTRVRRYRHIFCRFCDANLEAMDFIDELGDASCILRPRLASLLTGCFSSAELHLYVDPDHGEPALFHQNCTGSLCNNHIFQRLPCTDALPCLASME